MFIFASKRFWKSYMSLNTSIFSDETNSGRALNLVLVAPGLSSADKHFRRLPFSAPRRQTIRIT